MTRVTMEAAQILSKGEEYTVKRVDKPKIMNPTDIIFKTMSAGLCHTDFMVRDAVFGDNFPIIGSHEAVGIIDEVGSEVKDFKVGDRVGCIAFQNACGKCADCSAQLEIYCDNAGGMGGVTTDGGFAEYMRADSRFSVLLPEEIPFPQAAPLMCAGATVYGALQKSQLKTGEVVGFVGLGGLGHIGIQLAKCMGLKVVAVDNREEPLRLSKSLKYPPDLCINSAEIQDPLEAVEQIKRITKSSPWIGLDAVIVATDATPAFLYASKLTRKHGRLVVVGQPSDPVPIKDSELIFRNITVVGSLLSNIRQAKEMIDLIAKHKIEVTVKKYRLKDINQMVHDFHQPNMKGRFVVSLED